MMDERTGKSSERGRVHVCKISDIETRRRKRRWRHFSTASSSYCITLGLLSRRKDLEWLSCSKSPLVSSVVRIIGKGRPRGRNHKRISPPHVVALTDMKESPSQYDYLRPGLSPKLLVAFDPLASKPLCTHPFRATSST